MPDDDMYVRITGRYALLLNGLISVEDLDDDEVARGQLKDKNGQFRGRPPKLIPADLVQAMRREWLGRAEAKLRAALMEVSLDGMIEIAKDKNVDPGVRLRAQLAIQERTMGKVPDKVQLSAEDPVEALFRSILSDPNALVPHEPSAEERELI